MVMPTTSPSKSGAANELPAHSSHSEKRASERRDTGSDAEDGVFVDAVQSVQDLRSRRRLKKKTKTKGVAPLPEKKTTSSLQKTTEDVKKGVDDAQLRRKILVSATGKRRKKKESHASDNNLGDTSPPLSAPAAGHTNTNNSKYTVHFRVRPRR